MFTSFYCVDVDNLPSSIVAHSLVRNERRSGQWVAQKFVKHYDTVNCVYTYTTAIQTISCSLFYFYKRRQIWIPNINVG